MLYVCISFDYELFMGKNYVSGEEVLLKPSEKISKMLKQLGVSATFFADVCCPEAYRRLGKPGFADAFDEQLRFLTEQGHDVQLHIHPHWKKATQVGRNVEFPRDAYRIHNWVGEGEDYGQVQEMIRSGIEYLNRVIKPIDPDYRCLAFRAGGYCLQPEKQLASILFQEGIRIDSSVCRGMAYDGDGMYYDYRAEPRENNVYISETCGLGDNVTEPVSGGLLEVPVAGYSTFPYRPIASKLNRGMGNGQNNGQGMALSCLQVSTKQGLLPRIKRIISATNMITFDSYSAEAMTYMLKCLSKEYRNKDCYISAIAHPKMQSDDHIENMKTVIENLQKTGKIKFVSMREIAQIRKI